MRPEKFFSPRFLARVLAFLGGMTATLPVDCTGQAVAPAKPGVVFLTPARLASLRERIDTRTEPTFTAWQAVRAAAEVALDRRPSTPESGEYKVPGFYQKPAEHRAAKGGLQRDANGAYALALAYRMTGEARYADAAARIIMAWTGVRRISFESDSTLTFSYHFPAMIFAADLLRESTAWTAEHERRFRDYLGIVHEQERLTGKLRWPVWDSENNWGSWGNVLGMSTAAYTGDRELLGRMVARWKHLVETSIAADGHLPHEVHRNRNSPGSHGLWYSHFFLQPMCLSAEIARVNGIDLYGHVSHSGRSLRLAYDRLVPWLVDLRDFPYYAGRDKTKLHAPHAIGYFELLQPRWPRPDAARLIEERRPLETQHSSPFTTFTHGGLPANL